MSLIDRIEALSHAKGWHADQRAHQAADRRWLLRTIAYDRVRLYPPDPGGPDRHDVSTADAALWLLLRVSGLPDVDVGQCLGCDGAKVNRARWERHDREAPCRLRTPPAP